LNIDNFITKAYELDDLVVAVTGNERRHYFKDDLTKCWLTMSNDSFYNVFGFNWVPTYEQQKKIRALLK
jgi:hypothetical protein